MIATLFSGLSGYITAGIAILVGIVGIYFHGKNTGVAQQKAANEVEKANQEVVDVQATTAHTEQAVKVASDAKADANTLSDADERERMRTKYTDTDNPNSN